MSASFRIIFRLATLLFAVLMCAQCIWLLLAQSLRPDIGRLPPTAAAAAAAVSQRDAAARAASIGVFRGELWGDAAFTYANLLFDQAQASAPGRGRTAQDAGQNVKRALGQAPAQPGVWLLRAGLALHFPSLGFNALDALKMSYYTGPSEQELIPLRLRIAGNSGMFRDMEIRQFMRRDLRLLIARRDTTVIGEAYDAASPDVQRFIEQTVGDIDPATRERLRIRAKHSQALPGAYAALADRQAAR